MDFFATQNQKKVREHLRNMIIFADWFKKSIKTVTGNCTSKELLYYLRIMEIEVSNRSFKDFDVLVSNKMY